MFKVTLSILVVIIVQTACCDNTFAQAASASSETASQQDSPNAVRSTVAAAIARTSSRRSRLSRMPKMYGDSFSTANIDFFSEVGESEEQVNYGSARIADCSTIRIGDNNSPVPTNRVYFLYQHFQNATVADSRESGDSIISNDVDIYTIGIEKTLCDDLISLEIRLPLLSSTLNDSTQTSLNSITAILKAALWQTEDAILSAGVGIAFPIGGCNSSVDIGPNAIEFDHQATHFLPFLGFAQAFGDVAFVNSFAQLNLPSQSNLVSISSDPNETQLIRQQPTLGFHLSNGLWLIRNPNARLLSGVAGLLELHYTTVLGADRSVSVSDRGSDASFTYTRYDSLNLTSGLHFELGQTRVRVGAVAPLRDGNDKFFDAEIHVSVNRHF